MFPHKCRLLSFGSTIHQPGTGSLKLLNVLLGDLEEPTHLLIGVGKCQCSSLVNGLL